MKLNLGFTLAVSFIFLSSCVSKLHRHTASAPVAPKSVTDFADYTMANTRSANRMPAMAGEHVDLSNYGDDVEVSADTFGLEAHQHAEMVFGVRNHPELSGTLSGDTLTSAQQILFVAIVHDISKNGPRPLAVQSITGLKLHLGGLVSFPNEQKSDALKVSLLEFRDQLFDIYKDLKAN